LDGKITAIIGASGSGKSTLLYKAGLISAGKHSYCFDGMELNLDKDKELSQLRKTKIGYIFQDNNLIETLSIKENIRLAATIAGNKITDEDIQNYLNYVELRTVNGSCYPKQLSGGEQQRAAIACVLAKQPDLIIADEPTSSLDAGNSEAIINIFAKIAHNENKKIIIATHNEKIYNQADVIYEIRNKQINLIKGKEHFSSPELEHNPILNDLNKLHLPFYMKYAKQTGRKGRLQRRIMVALCATAIAFSSVVYNFGDAFILKQQQFMNLISDREVLVVNVTAPLNSVLDVDEHLSITSGEADAFSQISNVDIVYPYFEFRSAGYDGINDAGVTEARILVTRNDIQQEYNFSADDDHLMDNFCLVPYFPEQTIEKRVKDKSSNSTSGYYISAQLAHLLHIDNLEQDVTLTLTACVPTAQHVTTMQVGEQGGQYDIDIDLSKLTDFEIQIAGILDDGYTNRYSNSGNNVIFGPYANLHEIMEETQADCFKEIALGCKEWAPSAYVVFSKHYTDVEIVRDKVKSINPNFKTASEYQDVKAMNSMIGNIKRGAFSGSLIVLTVILLLMAIIHMNHVLGRKYEIALLKANGLTRRELFMLIMAESVRYVFWVTVISSSISVVLIPAVNFLFADTLVSTNLSVLAINLLVALVSVCIPTLISVITINKYRPDVILRN